MSSKSFKQLRIEALAAKQVVFVTKEFGFDMFIADTSKCSVPVTDDIKEAERYADGFDDTKLDYWKVITGYNLEKQYV